MEYSEQGVLSLAANVNKVVGSSEALCKSISKLTFDNATNTAFLFNFLDSRSNK